MKRKILRWAIVPVVAAIGFVGLSSFTGEGESSGGGTEPSCSTWCESAKNQNCSLSWSAGDSSMTKTCHNQKFKLP
ncbi:hypothetical protein ABDK00_009970 [Niabella insulamsoli]|uniref:hypothetical protein n=1 Tax=Niabella insulamsoli TaxID=3144874 RepID=UPI0031FD080D